MRSFNFTLAAVALLAAAAATAAEPYPLGSATKDVQPARYKQFAATFAAAAEQGRQQGLGKRIGCDACEGILKDVVYVVEHAGVMNATIEALDDVCEKQTKVDSGVCKAVVAVVFWAAKELVDQINTLAWDIPITLCADVVKACKVPCCNTSFAPEQLHLTFASQQVVAPAVDYRITWVTLDATPAAQAQFRVAGSGAAWANSSAEHRTYNVGGWLGVVHSAVMAALAPATTYEYRVGDAALGVSAVFNFTTLPPNVGSAARPLKVVEIADMGYGPNSDATIASITERVEAGEVDFVLHPGDISYADGSEGHWDLFGRKIQPISARVPYMTAPGNHECWWNFTAYRTRMWMPAAGFGAPADAMYYSFSAGAVAFVIMDSETWYDLPSIDDAQERWVAARLTAANAARQFIVTAQHRPLYCTAHASDCHSRAAYLRSRLEQLFVKHGVAFNIAGHMHYYERTFPAVDDKLVTTNYTNPPAPAYVLSGAGGSREGFSGFGRGDVLSWSAAREKVFGYLDLAFSGGGGAEVAMTSTFRLATNHSVLDQFVMTKKL
jgi:hypothetical protein